MNHLDTLVKRLKNIGIDLKLIGNYPWIYLDSVNGKRVIEKFEANHGFNIAMMNVRTGKIKLTNTKEIFKIIRKYIKN